MNETNPLLRIDLNAPMPVYRQIVSAMRAFLVSGELAPGAILPTVRDLAMDLGVHHNTVAEAYRILADEGWLDLRRGRGAMVLDRPDPSPRIGAREDFVRRVRELIAEAQADGLSKQVMTEEMDKAIRRLSGETL